ncbi:MAG: hypothetical protein Q9181_001872 [Wetmoreana brouardii]
MAPRAFYYLFLTAWVSPVFSSAIPATDPAPVESQPVLDMSQMVNISSGPSFHSAWPLPNSAPNASFDELAQAIKPPLMSRATCDGATYGRNLPLESCRQAWLAIPLDQRSLRMGIRSQTRNDVPPADGTCIIEITSPKQGSYDIATGLEISRAAFLIVENCVSNWGGEGGRVDNLAPPAPPTGDCDIILNTMSTNVDAKLFGPPGSQSDIIEPIALLDHLFKQDPEKTSWYDIWAAATAVRQICVVQGRAGQAIDLGVRGNLMVQLMRRQIMPAQRGLAITS